MDKSLKSCKVAVELISTNFTKTAFKDLCNFIAELITFTSKFDNVKKPDLLLYFNQLLDCLQLLARIITEEYDKDVILTECRKSIQKRILFCLCKIETFKANSESPTRQLGCFINWMNNALERIKVVKDVKDFCEVECMFENIISNALSVAQICLDEDSKAIKGSCQSVLNSLHTLEVELKQHETNKAMIKLFIDNCGDKLCSLERKLDMAILRLTLEVFSGNSIDKMEENLDKFDLYIDRLMQIGLFATFCSSNVDTGINLLNSMANLEYLEQELVPSVMVMKKNSEICGNFVLIYKNYWKDEEIKFRKLLFEIIDVNAFTAMVKDEIGLRVDKIQETYKNRIISKEIFNAIRNPALVLLDFMSTASKNEQFNDKVEEIVEKIRLVTSELSKRIEILDESLETNQRLLKRCKVLKAEIKKLVLALRIEDFESKNDTECEFNEYSVLFNSLDRRGKSILTNRSILYRTRDVLIDESGNRSSKRAEPASRDQTKINESTRTLEFPQIVLSFRSKIENLTTELNVTEILNDLDELSTT